MSSDGVDCTVQVRGHVWDSLVSMVRVYANAASLNAGDEYLVTNSPEEISVKHRDSALNLRFNPETGEGCWRIIQPVREEFGEFRIEADGTLNFPAGSKPLDAAAIEWIEHLTHAEAHRPVANTP
jgi:hypothetical protein